MKSTSPLSPPTDASVNANVNAGLTLSEADAAPLFPFFRAPEDVRAHRRMNSIVLACVLMTMLSIGVSFYLYVRKPD